MKIIVIGSSGTIGAAVVAALAPRHEVIGASRHSSPGVDLEDRASIAALLRDVPAVDAVVCCAGGGNFKPLAELGDEDFAYAIRSKMMGQINVIREAMKQLKDGGSVTVTTGILAQKPMPGGATLSLANCAIEGFARAAALESARGIRVNVVSPPWVKETMVMLKLDPKPGMAAADVAKAYVAAVEGVHHGDIIDARRFA